MEHPIAVANLISGAGYDGPILAAAYLHDVVEKTEVKPSEIRERFGAEVAEVVEALTDDDSVESYGERKRALRRQVIDSGRDSVLIYAADRVTNMRDWRKVPRGRREEIGARLGTTVEERLELWAEDLEDLSTRDPEMPFLAEIELELRALHTEAGDPST